MSTLSGNSNSSASTYNANFEPNYQTTLIIPTQLTRKEAVKRREEERRAHEQNLGFPLKTILKEEPSKKAESDYVSLFIYFCVFALFYVLI